MEHNHHDSGFSSPSAPPEPDHGHHHSNQAHTAHSGQLPSHSERVPHFELDRQSEPVDGGLDNSQIETDQAIRSLRRPGSSQSPTVFIFVLAVAVISLLIGISVFIGVVVFLFNAA